jgi:hypothetical protein
MESYEGLISKSSPRGFKNSEGFSSDANLDIAFIAYFTMDNLPDLVWLPVCST